MNAHKMTAESARTVTVAEMLAMRTGGHWPVVLDLATPAGRSRGGRVDAQYRDTPRVDGWWAHAFDILDSPDRMIELRSFAVDGAIRVCAANKGEDQVIAVRNAAEVSVQWHVGGGLEVAATRLRRLLAAFGSYSGRAVVDPAYVFGALRCPAVALAQRLDACRDVVALTDALYALGADPSEAARMATVLTRCHRRTEIVAVAGGVVSSGAVGIVDADRGRILASSSMSADGQVWTTLSPGADHRIEQALVLLIETLPECGDS